MIKKLAMNIGKMNKGENVIGFLKNKFIKERN